MKEKISGMTDDFSMNENEKRNPGAGKKMIAIIGDAWHCAATIFQGVVKPVLERGYDPEVVYDYSVPWDRLSDFDLVFMSRYGWNDIHNARELGFGLRSGEKERWLSEDQEARLEAYVQIGGNLFLHHDAIGFYRRDGGIHRLSKAFFHRHPKRIEIEIRPVKEHSQLVDGVSPYRVVEEEFVLDLDEDQTDVFLESHSLTNGRSPQGWCHRHGRGKVLVLIPGHDETVIKHPMTRKLIDNSAAWLASETDD